MLQFKRHIKKIKELQLEQSLVNLLEDSKFKSFIAQFNNHVSSTAKLPLSEQRLQNAKFVIDQTKCFTTVYHTENIEILGEDNHTIPMRIYIPKQAKDLPIMMYFHGGGWAFGGIEDTDAICRRFASIFGVIVASVGYRLSPENPFPKPLEDCYAATKWIADNAKRFNGDPQHLLVCGESAGGNLAAAVALMARDKHGPAIYAQLLIYPVISSQIIDKVYDECPEHYFMTKKVMRQFWNMYAGASGNLKNPYASLDCAEEFKELPPALIITAEYDPLTYDIDMYAQRLQHEGIHVIKKVFPKLVHGFLYITLYDENQKLEWTQEIGLYLRQLIAK